MSLIEELIITNTFGEWLETVNEIIDDANLATANGTSNLLLRYDNHGSFVANTITSNGLNANDYITLNGSSNITSISQDFGNIDNHTIPTTHSIYHYLIGNTGHTLPLHVSSLQINNTEIISSISNTVNLHTLNDATLLTVQGIHDYLSGNSLSIIDLPLHSTTLQINNGPSIMSIDTDFTTVGDDRLATSAAIKEHVTDRINGLINGANGAFDTLGEIETAILNNVGTIDTILNNLTTKVTKPSFTTASNEYLKWDGTELQKSVVDLTPYTLKPTTISPIGKYLTWDGSVFVHSDIDPDYHIHAQHALLAGNTSQHFSANTLTAVNFKNQFYSTADSTSQIQTTYRNKGYVTAPYVYTKVIEALNEKDSLSTGLLIGDTGKTPSGQTVNAHQIGFFTKGNLAAVIDENKDLKLNRNLNVENNITVKNKLTVTNTNPKITLVDSSVNVAPNTHYLDVSLENNGNDLLIKDFAQLGLTTTTEEWISLKKDIQDFKVFGNTVWHENNVGPGSNLDADMVDGYHYSDIQNDYTNAITIATANLISKGGTVTKNGTVLNFEANTPGYHHILNFRSKKSSPDKGFILFQDHSNYCGGSSTDDGRLTIGVFNEFNAPTSSEELWLQGGGRLVYNVGLWDSELNGILGSPTVGSSLSYDWRVNDTSVMELNYSGELTVVGDISSTTGDVIASASDDRLKTNKIKVDNALEKIDNLEAFYFEYNDLAKSLGFSDSKQVGISAQQLKNVMPELVTLAPVDVDDDGNSISGENYLTVNYHKLSVLLLNAIKELKAEIEEIKRKI